MSEYEGWVVAPAKGGSQQSWSGTPSYPSSGDPSQYQAASNTSRYESDYDSAHSRYDSGQHSAGLGQYQPEYGADRRSFGAAQSGLQASYPAFDTGPLPFPGEPRRRPRRVGTMILGLFGAITLAGGSALAGGYAALELQSQNPLAASVRGASVWGVTGSLAEVARAVLPAVVTINTGTGAGSGVVISADGTILTNNHVIAGARGAVQVGFSDGKTARGQVVGADPKNDLAVVRVSGAAGLTALRFGDSDGVRVGDTVLAVGSPLGLDGSVTAGIVSALNRTIQEGSARNGTGASIEGAIQTDAAINPGNSGGALVNGAGELVGINTAIATSGTGSGNIGVGFAISSNTARTVAQRLAGGS